MCLDLEETERFNYAQPGVRQLLVDHLEIITELLGQLLHAHLASPVRILPRTSIADPAQVLHHGVVGCKVVDAPASTEPSFQQRELPLCSQLPCRIAAYRSGRPESTDFKRDFEAMAAHELNELPELAIGKSWGRP